MTRLQLIEMLTWEAKIAGNTESISQLNGIISDAIIFLGQTHPELLIIERVDYDLATQNPTVYVNALGIDRIEINSGDDLRESFTVPEEGKIVGPAPVQVWPKCYHIEGNAGTAAATPKGIRIVLSPPVTGDHVDDSFSVWYKKVPLLANDTDLVPDAWVPYLKKECLARIAMNRAKPEGDIAKGYTLGADQALKAHAQDDAQSTAATN